MTRVPDGTDVLRSSKHIAGRYCVVEPIARGGMGIVWLARDERLGRRVAVKQVLDRADGLRIDTSDARVRSYREARLAAQVRHPNVVTVFDLVEHDGRPCLILEYLPSRSLRSLIVERGRLEPAFVARLGAQIAAALSSAHKVGIVHCDVKPANILISGEDTAKISDFGIARTSKEASTALADVLIGTPAYLPPETARGESPTAAADVFSLGATLFAAVEGHSPYGSQDDAMSHLRAAAAGATLAPTRAGPLAPLLERALNADPANRPTMDVLLQELEGFEEDLTPTPSNGDTAPPGFRTGLPRGRRADGAPRRWKPGAVAAVAASALTFTALAVSTHDVLRDGKELTAAAPAAAPAGATPAAPAPTPVPEVPASPATTPDAAPTPLPPDEPSAPGSAAMQRNAETPDVPIEWSAAGQLVIDYYAGAERADGWTMLNPDARRGFGSSERFTSYWEQFSQVWAQNAYGVTENDDGSVNVPVDVTYVVDNARHDESRTVKVVRQNGRLFIATEAR